jgi:hypothetical protein
MVAVLMILVVLLLAIVVMLLFTPMVFMINTVKDLYRVQWGPVSAALYFREEDVRYRLHLPFYTRDGELRALLAPGEGRAQRKERPAPVHARTARGRSRFRPPLRALLRTFRVRCFHWRWDSGDVLWNARLFPVFHLLRLRGHDVAISFTGRSELILTLDNNLYRMLKAVLFHSIKTDRQ